MAKWMKLGYLGAMLTLQLSTAGCLGGGGGGGGFSSITSFLSSLFGGGDSSSVVSSLADAGSQGTEGTQTVEQLIEKAEQQQHGGGPVATLVNPEPGSLALFGGGLGALAVWRRRRARKSS